jgi:hypothetical protein
MTKDPNVVKNPGPDIDEERAQLSTDEGIMSCVECHRLSGFPSFQDPAPQFLSKQGQRSTMF